jgi:hypothetical protein
VHLTWSYVDHATVDEYRVYVGLYIDFGYGVFDTLVLEGTTADREFFYDDPGLALESEEICEALDLCDPLYTYTQFRVTAVNNGLESVASEKAFPTP